MSEISTKEFDPNTYISAKRHLSTGFSTNVMGGRIKDIENGSTETRYPEEELDKSLDLISPSGKTIPKNPQSENFENTKLSNSDANISKSTIDRQSFKTPNSPSGKTSPPQSTAKLNTISIPPSISSLPQTEQEEIQQIREKLSKMKFEMNGSKKELDTSSFTFEKQLDGSFKIQHPKLDLVTKSNIFIDNKGNFLTKEIKLEGFGLRFVGLEPGKHKLIQQQSTIQIAKL